MVSILLISSTATVFAASKTTNEKLSKEQFAKKYALTLEEVTNMQDNLDKAIVKLPKVKNGENVKVQVSDNLYLESSLTETVTPQKNSFLASTLTTSLTSYENTENTITATLKLKNTLGVTVVTLTSVGVFLCNGTISLPDNAYGSYTSVGTNIVTYSAIGPSNYNAWAKNVFSGNYTYSDFTLLSFSKTNIIYCNAIGEYSSSWY